MLENKGLRYFLYLVTFLYFQGCGDGMVLTGGYRKSIIIKYLKTLDDHIKTLSNDHVGVSHYNDLNTKIDNNQQALNGELVKLNTNFTNFDKDQKDFKTEIGNFKAEIGNFKTEIGNFKAEVLNLKNEVAVLHADIGDLNKAIVALNLVVFNLNAALVKFEAEVDKFTKEVAKLNNYVNDLHDEVDKFTKEVVKLKNEVDVLHADIGELNKAIVALNLVVFNLNAALVKFNAEVDKFTKEVVKLNNYINDLNNAIGALNPMVLNLNTAIDNVNLALVNLGQKLMAVETYTRMFTNKLNYIWPSFVTFKQGVADLKTATSNLGSLNLKITNLENKMNSLSSEIALQTLSITENSKKKLIHKYPDLFDANLNVKNPDAVLNIMLKLMGYDPKCKDNNIVSGSNCVFIQVGKNNKFVFSACKISAANRLFRALTSIPSVSVNLAQKVDDDSLVYYQENPINNKLEVICPKDFLLQSGNNTGGIHLNTFYLQDKEYCGMIKFYINNSKVECTFIDTPGYINRIVR